MNYEILKVIKTLEKPALIINCKTAIYLRVINFNNYLISINILLTFMSVDDPNIEKARACLD